MVNVFVFVADPDDPNEVAASAISRARAAARRFDGQVALRVMPLGSADAEARGATLDPTVAVDDLVLAVGQSPLAGHLVRALEVALGNAK